MKRIVLFLVAVFAVMAMEAAVVKGKIVDAGGSALDFVNVKLTSKTDNASVYPKYLFQSFSKCSRPSRRRTMVL